MISVIALRHRDSEAFVIKVTIPTDNYVLELPLYTDNNFVKFTPGGTINWGDGVKVDRTIENRFHTYATAGDYKIKIKGDYLDGWSQGNVMSSTIKDLSYDIEEWGNFKIGSQAFRDSNLMTCSATDEPGLAIDDSGKINLAYSFDDCHLFDTQTLNNLDFSVHINSNSWNLFNTFYQCYNFTGDLSTKVVDDTVRWDTSKCDGIYNSFRRCYSFEPPSNWNTSNINSLVYSFGGCTGFTSSTDLNTKYVQLSNGDEYIAWDVRNVTNFNGFADSTNMQNGVNSWRLSSLPTKMSGSFSGIKSFNSSTDFSTKISTIGSGTSLEETYIAWDTESVTSISSFFRSTNIPNVPVNWNTSNVVDMQGLFQEYNDGTSVINVSIKNSVIDPLNTYGLLKSYTAWNTSNVVTLKRLFWKNSKIVFAGIEFWDVSSVKDMEFAFHTSVLTGEDLSIRSASIPNVGSVTLWNTDSLTNTRYTFYKSTLDFDLNWNLSKVIDSYAMFYLNDGFTSLTNLTSISISTGGTSYDSWDLSALEESGYMFSEFGRSLGIQRSFAIKMNPLNTDYVAMFQKCGPSSHDWTYWDFNGDIDVSLFGNEGSSIENMDPISYQNLLQKWDDSGITNRVTNVNSYRTNSSDLYYSSLISKGWTIIDLGNTP